MFVIEFSDEVGEDFVKKGLELLAEAGDDGDAIDALTDKYIWLSACFTAVVAYNLEEDDSYSFVAVGDSDDCTEYCLAQTKREREKNWGGDLSPYTFRFASKIEVYNCLDMKSWQVDSELSYILDYAYGTRSYYDGEREEWNIGDAMCFIRNTSRDDYTVYSVVDEVVEDVGDYSVDEAQQIFAALSKSEE